MRTRTTKGLALGVAAAVVAAWVATGGLAGAEDERPAGMPAMQKKLDHPLAKAIVGAWDVAHKSEQYPPTTGTVKFALGVGDTAIVQDYEISMGPMGTFVGHAVWKVSDDGKTTRLWWIDTMSSDMQLFEGSISDTGFDVKSGDGTRLTLAKVENGFEFKLFQSGADAPRFTDTYTKKP